MRQKSIKGVDEALLKARGVMTDIETMDFPEKPLHLEIGSGKGAFITSLALDFPDIHFIALEKNKYVCYRILEKKENLGLLNLSIILGDASDLPSYLGERKVSHIYLNFSDPWPKKRHHKRRLTALSFLTIYEQVMLNDALLQFRTDHESFFNDAIETISQPFEIIEIDRDLKESPYMTEYEVKKRKIGPIYQLKGRKKHVT